MLPIVSQVGLLQPGEGCYSLVRAEAHDVSEVMNKVGLLRYRAVEHEDCKLIQCGCFIIIITV